MEKIVFQNKVHQNLSSETKFWKTLFLTAHVFDTPFYTNCIRHQTALIRRNNLRKEKNLCEKSILSRKFLDFERLVSEVLTKKVQLVCQNCFLHIWRTFFENDIFRRKTIISKLVWHFGRKTLLRAQRYNLSKNFFHAKYLFLSSSDIL